MIYLFKIFFTNFYNNLIEIIFPEFCVGCNKLNTLLCNSCFEKLEFVQFQNKSINCCCYYQGLAKKIIHELKYKGVINVGKTIANIMYYCSDFKNVDFITFVPMHKIKIGKRGFNQSEIIAVELAKLLNKPIGKLLIKTKNTKSQMSLGKKENRQKNILGTIEINPLINKNDTKDFKSVLIVDDVFTSGTTLNYCEKILKENGIKNIQSACFLFRN